MSYTFNSLNIKKTHYRDITQQATSHFAGSEGDIDGPYFCVGVRSGSDRAQFCTELHLRQWRGEGWVTVTSLCRLPLNAFSSDRFKAEDGHTSSIRSYTHTDTQICTYKRERNVYFIYSSWKNRTVWMRGAGGYRQASVKEKHMFGFALEANVSWIERLGKIQTDSSQWQSSETLITGMQYF